MHRVPEVIDCWFDSGAMPFAQHHYPFENQDVFKRQFPAQFISEAVDQTRGWFYSLMAESTLLFNRSPFENVIVMGHVLDENGQKMSKSKGNAVDPFEALEKYGADATPMRSLYCMRISIISMRQSIHWNMISFPLWINGFCPDSTPW